VNALELKKFVHEMQTSAVFHGCTVFLLTSGKLDQVDPEHTVVDGLIELEERLWGVRAERSLQVRKFRGSSALRGLHSFQIRDDGMTVFPRIEALFTEPPVAASGEQVLSSGVMTLDRMIGQGGLPRSGATVVVGSTGTGKTTFGLHFLSQSTIEEPGLFFGFFESPDRLRSRGPSLGIDIAGLEAQGALKLVWQPQGEHLLDELGHRLLTEVTNGGIKRLVIDGLASFFEAALERERIGRFFSCLVNELRRRGVTLISTLETRDAVGSVVPTPYGVSAIVDSLIFLRYADAAGELKRLVSILKVRGSDFDPTVREMRIASAGIVIGRRFTMPDSIVPDAHPVVDGPEEVHNEGPSAQRGEDADST
jgi:circadian clock protein KaiC